VQVATRMPNIFRALYRDQVGTDPLLRTVYLRLLEFDDLRPQKAIVRFILDIRPPVELRAQFRGRPDKWQEEMWRKVEPAVCRLLDDVRETACGHPDARAVVPRWIRAVLWLRPWRWGIPLGLVRLFGWCMGLFDSDSRPYLKAQRERVLVGEGGADFVAAGHTHLPQVAHLYMDRQERKKYFVDTGTWRNAVLGAARRRQFGRVNATTFVAFFGPREPRTRAFEFRTGLGQEWPVDDSDQ
jgi:hypothetical protein